MKKLGIILIICCCLFASCTTTKLLKSTTAPSEITDLKLLEPCSYISMITTGNYTELNDSVSDFSKQLNISVLNGLKGSIPLTGQIFIAEASTNIILEKEYEILLKYVQSNNSITKLKITPTLDRILEANQTRFGLIVITSGFTREKGNYGKEIAKGAAKGCLQWGCIIKSQLNQNL